MFRKDIRGFPPELMEKMYQDRVIFKKKMIAAKKEYEKTKNKELVKEIARCNKIAGVESKKTDTEIKNIEQEVKESKNRIKDILAGIPQKEEAYYVQKAQERLFDSIADLNKISGELNEENKKKVNMETHVLMKTYDRIESEIENINIDTDQKREIIDLLRDNGIRNQSQYS